MLHEGKKTEKMGEKCLEKKKILKREWTSTVSECERLKVFFAFPRSAVFEYLVLGLEKCKKLMKMFCKNPANSIALKRQLLVPKQFFLFSALIESESQCKGSIQVLRAAANYDDIRCRFSHVTRHDLLLLANAAHRRRRFVLFDYKSLLLSSIDWIHHDAAADIASVRCLTDARTKVSIVVMWMMLTWRSIAWKWSAEIGEARRQARRWGGRRVGITERWEAKARRQWRLCNFISKYRLK